MHGIITTNEVRPLQLALLHASIFAIARIDMIPLSLSLQLIRTQTKPRHMIDCSLCLYRTAPHLIGAANFSLYHAYLCIIKQGGGNACIQIKSQGKVYSSYMDRTITGNLNEIKKKNTKKYDACILIIN